MSQCSAMTHPVERYRQSAPCMRQAKVTVAGKEYCTQHGQRAQQIEEAVQRAKRNYSGPINIS